jgi:hypothetical protein
VAEGDQGGGVRSDRLDRVSRPDGSRHRPHEGKEALYSTAPTAAPSSQVLLVCRRCDVESGLSLVELASLAVPPFVWNPLTGFLWARCPACERRSRLYVRKGQALRALLDRTPRR